MFDLEKSNMKPHDIPQGLLDNSAWDMPSQVFLCVILSPDKASTTCRLLAH